MIGALERGLGDEASEVRPPRRWPSPTCTRVEALPALLFAVEDDDPFVRQMAFSAVGELGDPRARERLRRALSDARAEVRFQAVIGFVRVAPDALEALSAALGDPDGSIRYIALRSAEELALGVGRTALARVLGQGRASARRRESGGASGGSDPACPVGRGRSHAVLVDVVRGELVTREAEDEAAAIELVGDLGLRGAPLIDAPSFRALWVSLRPFRVAGDGRFGAHGRRPRSRADCA